jgi:hypothetical protein
MTNSSLTSQLEGLNALDQHGKLIVGNLMCRLCAIWGDIWNLLVLSYFMHDLQRNNNQEHVNHIFPFQNLGLMCNLGLINEIFSNRNE